MGVGSRGLAGFGLGNEAADGDVGHTGGVGAPGDWRGSPAGRRAAMAELIASGKTPKRLEPFALTRFYDDQLVGEKAAASVSH